MSDIQEQLARSVEKIGGEGYENGTPCHKHSIVVRTCELCRHYGPFSISETLLVLEKWLRETHDMNLFVEVFHNGGALARYIHFPTGKEVANELGENEQTARTKAALAAIEKLEDAK